MKNHQKPKVISLFSGAGGMDIGFENAGFETVVAVEFDPSCCDTLRANRPHLKVIQGDVSSIKTEDILLAANLKPLEAGLVIGGPPCQSFSLAGKRLGMDEPRGRLVLDFIRIVREALPVAFVMENVKGMSNWQNGAALRAIEEELSDPISYMDKTYQYVIQHKVLNAANFGVPQFRERIFLVGNRLGKEFSFPRPTHKESNGQVDLFGNKVRDQKSEILSTPLEAGRNQKPKVSLEEFLAIYEKTWIDDWYASRKEHDEYKQKGKKALTEFYKKIEKDIPVPKYLERPFNLKIEDDGDEYTIKGVIDRIDHLNGGIEIIDYKTGQGRTEKNFSAEDKEQLLIYQLAATQVLGEKVENLSFYYVEVGNKVSFLGTEKELKAIEKKIINTIKEIKKGKFPPKPGKICDWCDFKNICEYRAL